MILSRWKVRNVIEALGAQRPWGCVDDWWKSVLGFWDEEGGPVMLSVRSWRNTWKVADGKGQCRKGEEEKERRMKK